MGRPGGGRPTGPRPPCRNRGTFPWKPGQFPQGLPPSSSIPAGPRSPGQPKAGALSWPAAQRRKAQGLTQVQLADALDVSQQAITAYESGQRRVPISSLPLLASTLGVSVEALIGASAKRGAGKRGPAPKLQQQLERVHALPKAQ